MKKVSRSGVVVVALTLGMLVASGCWAAGPGPLAPKINHSKMMLEHEDMACTNCHGVHGPKDVKMGMKTGQKCTDCHKVEKTIAKQKQKSPQVKGAPPLLGSMMMEHENMDCSNCHGTNGPKDVKMGNKPGQNCLDCHKVMKKNPTK